MPDRIFKPYDLDRVVIAEALDVVGTVQGPERREAALLEEAVECSKRGEERGERVGLVLVRGVGGALVEEGDAEVEVGEGGGGECFDEDVDHYVWVVEVWVKLVTY